MPDQFRYFDLLRMEACARRRPVLELGRQPD